MIYAGLFFSRVKNMTYSEETENVSFIFFPGGFGMPRIVVNLVGVDESQLVCKQIEQIRDLATDDAVYVVQNTYDEIWSDCLSQGYSNWPDYDDCWCVTSLRKYIHYMDETELRKFAKDLTEYGRLCLVRIDYQ